MKKLMFMFAAVACAAALQAASVVNWNSGTLYAPNADGTGWSSDMVEDGATGYLATLLVGTDYSGDTLTGLIDFASGDTSSTVDMNALYNTTSASLADDTKYYAQLIITHGDSTLKSQIVSFETSSLSNSGDPYFGDGGMMIEPLPGQTLDGTYGAFSATTGWAKTDPSPEPTSGLLLLVGAGILGLRRKRA